MAEVTPTTMPTPTKTEFVTPMEDFSDLSECRTWREAREKCVVTVEDLMSGRLVDFARKVTKPFPDNAFNSGFPNIVSGTSGDAFMFKPGTEGMDTKTIAWAFTGEWGVNNAVFADPRSPMGDKLLFWLEPDGTSEVRLPMLILIEKVQILMAAMVI